MRKARPLPPLSIPSLKSLIRYPLPLPPPMAHTCHTSHSASAGIRAPLPLLLSHPDPRDQQRAAWGFPQRPPQDRMLCTPESTRKHPGPSDHNPTSVYCLRSHFVEATWLFFYLLSVCSAGSFIRSFICAFIPSVLRKLGPVLDAADIGMLQVISLQESTGPWAPENENSQRRGLYATLPQPSTPCPWFTLGKLERMGCP